MDNNQSIPPDNSNMPMPVGKQYRVTVAPDDKPVFANSVQMSVGNDAVVLQFLFLRPNTEQAVLVSEIAITPQHAISFQKALDDTIKRHFTRHLDQG